MDRFFEFSDQPWTPRALRDLLTETLQFQTCTYGTYAPAIPLLRAALAESGLSEILDLCSGSGGPLPHLRRHLAATRITLSDRFPSRRTIDEVRHVQGVNYVEHPVDARAVGEGPPALRTMFTSFHHFAPADARLVLGDAVRSRAPIAVFEFTEHRAANFGRMLASLLGLLRDSWRIRPRTVSRLLWTYVVPVVPMVYAWDGLVSHWRTYGPRELRAMTAAFPTYRWRVGKIPFSKGRDRLTYLVGIPLAPAGSASTEAA